MRGFGAFVLASQESELFNLSLRESLSMGRTISDEEICSLLRNLGPHDLLQILPEGLGTTVGEKALNSNSATN